MASSDWPERVGRGELLFHRERSVGPGTTAKQKGWRRHLRKRICCLAVRIRRPIAGLRWRTDNDRVRAFSLIFRQNFGSRDPGASQGRMIRTRTVRAKLGLARRRLRLGLAWMFEKQASDSFLPTRPGSLNSAAGQRDFGLVSVPAFDLADQQRSRGPDHFLKRHAD